MTNNINKQTQLEEVLHKKREEHIKQMLEMDFDTFLEDQMNSLTEQLSTPENLNILKRLKDK